jgi:hypothetical protein
MLAKYRVQFSVPLEHCRLVDDFHTDDPVEFENFIFDLFLRGYHINSISHQGVMLSGPEFDSAVLLGAKAAIIKLLTAAMRSMRPKPDTDFQGSSLRNNCRFRAFSHIDSAKLAHARNDQARRRRKQSVARDNVTTAISAIGQTLANTTSAGMAFRKTPLTITMMYRSGLAKVTTCSQSGIFSIGLMYPDMVRAGIITVIVPSIACC